jgi:hypothetical protein
MNDQRVSRELFTIEQFVTLSAKINYQLSAHALRKPVLLSLLLGPTEVRTREQDVLLDAFDVLQTGYAEDRRRLGTPGILHPIRTTAMLARTVHEPTLMHLLGGLLHDKQEDLTEGHVGPERWREMQGHYARLLDRLGPGSADDLSRRIDVLSNKSETYEAYLGRILDHAYEMPDLLHVKLMDRLDNTFDIHLQHPGITKFNFYRAVFDMLFLPNFGGVNMGRFHFMPDAREGVMLLSQLFKDLIFLTLIRKEKLDTLDVTTRRLFVGLAVAGIREAQWLALEIFNTCITNVPNQRELLLEVMQYCTSGGIEGVHLESRGGRLDGMLLSVFTAQKEGKRRELLTELFEDHDRLALMVLTFIVVFASYINDPEYTVRGIGRDGMSADEQV